MYTREKDTNKNSTYWECVKRRRGRCKGRAITQQIGENHSVKLNGFHNHPPNNSKTEQ